MTRIESLEEEHVCADRSHGEVDDGTVLAYGGTLPPEQATRLLTVLVQLRDLYRHHIAIEDNEVFPAAAAALSASDRQAIGSEMSSRRNVRSGTPCSAAPVRELPVTTSRCRNLSIPAITGAATKPKWRI